MDAVSTPTRSDINGVAWMDSDKHRISSTRKGVIMDGDHSKMKKMKMANEKSDLYNEALLVRVIILYKECDKQYHIINLT